MARARNIKPGLFSNELLVELPAFDRLAFIGLWCLADREGRLEDRVKRIKIELFPCDDYDVDAGLSRLAAAGFIARYQVAGQSVIEIVNFQKHQSPHGSEKDSLLPDINGYLTVHERKKNVVVTGSNRKVLVSDRELNVKESLEPVDPPLDNALIPDCGILIPDSGFTESKPLSIAEAPDDANQDSGNETGDQDQPTPDQLALADPIPLEDPKPPTPDEGFEKFYKLYPRKQKRADAERAWRKLAPNQDLRTKMTIALLAHCLQADWTKDDGQYIPLPASWINGRRWEDEPVSINKAAQQSSVLSVPKHTQEMYPDERF